jgi:hypothetical protein
MSFGPGMMLRDSGESAPTVLQLGGNFNAVRKSSIADLGRGRADATLRVRSATPSAASSAAGNNAIICINTHT